MNCNEFAHFADPVLNDQHHRILQTLDSLIEQLRVHDQYEKAILSPALREKYNDHWKSHASTLDYVAKVRAGLVAHINNDDTKLFS